jgi:hypothetical protein
MGDFQQIREGQPICVFGLRDWLERIDFTQSDERCLGPIPNPNELAGE